MTKSYEELIADMTQIIAQVHERAFGIGYEQGRFDAEMNGHYNTSPPSIDELIKIGREATETPQEKRDRIVEKAKVDVADLERANFEYGNTFEYIHNLEKRTVVALGKISRTGRVVLRGIAKCAPGDCFNTHIGRAISLRRALGLEVPAEYLNAPQPTEVRVGDKIRLKLRRSLLNGNIETVAGFNFKGKPLTIESPGHVDDDQYDITYDSREGV